MYLYLISQNTVDTGEYYDSAVVVAKDERDARQIVPGEYDTFADFERDIWLGFADGWAPKPSLVLVQLLGRADASLPRGEVCSSWNMV